MSSTAQHCAISYSTARTLKYLFIFILAAMAFDGAIAQVTIGVGGAGGGGQIGQDAWSAMKNVWFGPIGLVAGAIVFALSVYFYFKDGVLAVLGVLGVGVFFFFIPAMVLAVQNWARNV